jgi:uncharacterized protein (TIRG00374 family)
MADASPRPTRRWHTILVAGLTIGLVWWFVRSLNFPAVGRAISSAHLGLIVAATLITVQTYVIRTWRWQVLLLPIGRPRFRSAFRATVIGFTATFLLPGRVGEVLRPYMLARREGFSAAAAMATVIIERILDVASVLLLFACFLLTTRSDVGAEVRWGGALAAAAAITALVVLAVSAGHPERVGRWATRVTRILPGRLADLAGSFARAFIEGLAVMRRPGAMLWAMALSIPLWLSLSLGVWLTSRAFDVHFPLAATFLVMVFLTVGVAMPTPGGVGGFHQMYLLAVTMFFRADPDAGGAAAIVLHALSILPVSLLGLWFMAQDGLSIGRLRTLGSVPAAASPSEDAAP